MQIGKRQSRRSNNDGENALQKPLRTIAGGGEAKFAVQLAELKDRLRWQMFRNDEDNLSGKQDNGK